MNLTFKIYYCHKYFFLFILAYIFLQTGLPLKVIGQEKLRLEDCYKIALTNRFEVKNAQIERQNANCELIKEKTGFIPSLNISYSHNVNYSSNTNSILGDYTGTLSTSINMKLFDWFSVWKHIDIAELALYQQDEHLKSIEFDILIDVTESFFSLLFRKEQLIAVERQLNLTDSILENTTQLYSLGKIMQNDVEEAFLQFTQEKKSQIMLRKDYELAEIALAELLQVQHDNLSIDFEYYENYLMVDLDYDDYSDFERSAIEKYPYLKVLETKKKILLVNDQLIRSQYRPKINLNCSASTGYSELVLNNSEMNFYDNINSSFAGIVSFTLNIPVFNNREIRTNVLINEANILQNENRYSGKLLELKASLEKQYIDAKASIEKFHVSQQELITIKKILDNRLLLYKNGKNDIFTVLTYKKQYNDIERSYIISKYEAILKNELLKLYVKK